MTPQVFRSSRALVWLLGGIAFAMFLPTLLALFGVRDEKGQPLPIAMVVTCSLFGTAMGIGALWVRCSYVIADEAGLRWRGIGPEYHARWGEITDYFIRLSPQSQRAYIVKTASGRQLSFDESLTGYKNLAQQIALQATQAKANGWLLQSKAGTLFEKQIFTYSEKAYRSFLWQQFLLPTFLLIPATILLLSPETRSIWPIQLVLALVFLGTTPWTWRAIQEAQKYKGTRLEADEHTLTFVRADGDEQTIRWSEIVRVQAQMPGLSKRYELHTKDALFYVHEYVEHWGILRGLLHQYCPLILSHSTPTGDALLSTEKTNSKRVFHYQTRTNRHMLGVLLLCTLLPLWAALYVWNTYRQSPDPDMPSVVMVTPLVLIGLLIVGWGWALWRYKSTRLILDAEGITQFDLRGTVRVTYDAITHLGASDWFYVETADGKHPIRWSPGIADADQLRQELEARTGLGFNKEPVAPSPEIVEKVQNPAEQSNDVQQQLERRHTGR